MRSGTAIFYVILLFMPAATTAFGQSTSPTKATEDHSKEPVIVQKVIVHIVYENDGTWTRDAEGAIRMQSEAGIQRYGLLVFGYSSSNDKLDISFVRVRKSDGAVVETPPENIQDLASDISRQAPMYSDYREKHIAVKGLGIGDTLEFSVRLTESKPIIQDQFWAEYTFSKSDIILDEEVEITVPKDRKLNLKSPELKPEISDSGQRRRYSWKTSNLKRLTDDSSKATPREDATPSIQLSSFRNWNEVARWWGRLEEQQVQPSPEIRTKAADLTKHASTDAERLHSIYDYVSTRFRYISLSFGIGRYQPHPADEVLRNEYGDCKDKHTLLEALLRASGINAYPALISATRKIDPDVPSPAQFDHVITAVPQGPDVIWLDTTAEVSPFGFILANLRDKQALIIAENKPVAPANAGTINAWRESPVIRTPSNPPFKSAVTFEIDAKLDDKGTLTGKVQRSFRGDMEVILRSAFRQTPQTQWKDLVQQISFSSGFGGTVTDIDVSTPEDTLSPFRISYNYSRQEYPDWANKRISVPSPLQGLPVPADEKSASSDPIELGGPLEISSVSRVQMPSGYMPDLRSPADLESDFGDFHSKNAFENGLFSTEYRLNFKTREVSPSRIADYRNFVKQVNDKLEGFTGFSSSNSILDSGEVERTQDLVQQAGMAFQAGDMQHAIGLYKKAVKIDPKNKDAWIALSRVQIAIHQSEEGLDSLHKAIDADPDDIRTYLLLAGSYVYLKRVDDAIALTHSVLKTHPDCFECHLGLGGLSLTRSQFSEAVSEFQAAAKLNPNNARVPVGLGQAYLGLGDPDRALKAFQDAIALDHGAIMLNNVAWYLADAGQKLPDALQFSQRAVQNEENDSTDVDLDNLKTTDLARMNSLARDWDTLGWVYFRQGDLATAAKYIEAAWYLDQSPVLGSHLAQIYEKQGKKAEAIHVCAMAVAANQQVPEPREYLEKLIPDKVKRDALIKAGASEVSEIRRYRLIRPPGHKAGSAEFFVLLAPEAKVEDVRFISGEQDLNPLVKEIQEIRFNAPLPDGSDARLVRRGILVCTGTGCDFVLIPTDSVFSTK